MQILTPHPRPFRFLATAVVASVALWSSMPSGTARAQGASSEGASKPPPTAAVGHYERGREHYLAGRYREALVELKAALVLDPASPTLLYNVARVNENLGNLDEALAYYERYLAGLPSSESAERTKTEETIRRLHGAKDELAQSNAGSGDWKTFGPSPRQPEALGRADLLFWITAGSGAALAIAGGITGVVALQRQNDAGDFVVGLDGTLDDRARLAKQADNFALASDVLFITGGAALTTAALLFFLRDPEASGEAPSAALGLHPEGATLTTRLRF